MEINIPFTSSNIVLEENSKDLKYRAILSRDSLFYGFFDLDDKLIHFDTISTRMIKKLSFLKSSDHSFSESAIAFNNSIFTFLSKDDDLKEHLSYLKFNNSISDIRNYVIKKDTSLPFGIRLYYAIPKPIQKAISKHLPSTESVHYQSVFLASIPDSNFNYKIGISLMSGNMNIALINKDQKLIMSNCYQVKNESDFYYYIALLYDQFELRKGDVEFFLEGDFTQVKLDKQRFALMFGEKPIISTPLHSTNETNSNLVPLIRLNRCASLEEV